MIVDDPDPFFNQLALGQPRTVHGDSHLVLPGVRPLGRSGEDQGQVFGRARVWAGSSRSTARWASIPATRGQERLEWIEMIKTLYEPRFTITPEIITHWYPWDIDDQEADADGPTRRTIGWPRKRRTSRPDTLPRRCRCSRMRESPPAA